MELFQINELSSLRAQSGRAYLEFLRVPQMSLGIYALRAGEVDRQEPHTEDEAYYIVSGRAVMHMGREDRAVAAGCIIFVPARVEHRFHSISEDLTVLVSFAPAEAQRPSN